MPKTAEQMNSERRAAKQRQNQAARAKALGNKQQAEFSMADAMKDTKRRQKHLARSAENGQRLLEQLKQKKALQISPKASGRYWESDARDLIAAAKADEGLYVWNKDWRERTMLAIAIKR